MGITNLKQKLDLIRDILGVQFIPRAKAKNKYTLELEFIGKWPFNPISIWLSFKNGSIDLVEKNGQDFTLLFPKFNLDFGYIYFLVSGC